MDRCVDIASVIAQSTREDLSPTRVKGATQIGRMDQARYPSPLAGEGFRECNKTKYLVLKEV
jgi:hypothetical protein